MFAIRTGSYQSIDFMVIELGKFKEKAAAAQAEKEARAREEAELAKAESESKGREREQVAQELDTATQEISTIETSLAEAGEFAKENLALLSPEDQATLQSQIDGEKQRAEELKRRISELTARKEALDTGVTATSRGGSPSRNPGG